MKLNRRITAVAIIGALMAMLVSFGPTNLAHAAPQQLADWPVSASAASTQTAIPIDIKSNQVWSYDANAYLYGDNWQVTAVGTPDCGVYFDCSSLTPQISEPGAHAGSDTVNTATISYTPPDGFSGTITFSYTFTRTGSPTGTGNVVITVSPVLSLTSTAEARVINYTAQDADISADFAAIGSGPFRYYCLTENTTGGSVTTDATYTPPVGPASDTLDCTVKDIYGLESNQVTVLVDIQQWWTVNFIDSLTNANSTFDVKTGEPATNPASDLSQLGYSFDGWFKDCSNKIAPYAPTEIVDDEQYWYACWTKLSSPSGTANPANSGDAISGASQNGNNTANGYGGGYTGPGVFGSQVRLVSSSSSLTGGSGALADGQDTQLLQATLGGNQSGSTSGFSVSSSPTGVQLSSVTRNSDGTFRLALTSTTPGIYQVSVRYNGVTIGTVTVNFIAGTASIPSAMAGSSQVLTGYGFMPGEMVTISVHSDPIQVARLAADANGTVQATFVIPKGFALGAHTAIFAGDRSGTATAAFTVGTMVSTGGSVSSTGSAGLAGLLVMAGLAAAALIWRRRTSLAG